MILHFPDLDTTELTKIGLTQRLILKALLVRVRKRIQELRWQARRGATEVQLRKAVKLGKQERALRDALNEILR